MLFTFSFIFGLWFEMQKPAPAVIGGGAAHAPAQQFQALRFRQKVGKELCSIAQGTRSAMIPVDHGPS
jgi:hypothetical protein